MLTSSSSISPSAALSAILLFRGRSSSSSSDSSERRSENHKLFDCWVILHAFSGFVKASKWKFKDFSKTSKTSPTVFKDLKLMKNTDLSVEILLQKR